MTLISGFDIEILHCCKTRSSGWDLIRDSRLTVRPKVA